MADAIVADIDCSGIYQIRNLLNGKRYTGSACKFRGRWHNHRSQLRRGIHGNVKLQNAWAKAGEQSFSFEVIELCGKDDLAVREQHWLDTTRPEYNIAMFARSYQGRAATQEQRQRTSEANKGNKYCVGRVISAETRAKISAAKLGRKHKSPRSPEHTARIAKAHTGLKRSDETRKRISEAQLRSWASRKTQRH